MTISGGRTKQLDIFCRVTGFTSDFLSFIVVEHIRFFHGALQLSVHSRYWTIGKPMHLIIHAVVKSRILLQLCKSAKSKRRPVLKKGLRIAFNLTLAEKFACCCSHTVRRCNQCQDMEFVCRFSVQFCNIQLH